MALMRRLALSLLPVVAGLVMIMTVVVINGRPSVFTDTDDYFVEGRSFVLGLADATGDAQQLAADEHMSHTEIGARSPYYGAFLYVTQKIGTLWFTTIVQALIGAWLVWRLWQVACPRAPPWTAYLVEAVCAFGSTMPFFASFAMPDIFAAYAAIAATLLLVFSDRLHIAERAALAGLLVFSMVVHTSHLLNT